MANPEPEISPEDALAARSDVIIATGRSDYPNQVNNVLGFPFIFRGALDVAATGINEEMKLAAAHALADLAKEDVPDSVVRAYGGKPLRFGREYLIPKPFDYRVLLWEAPAVAEAAIASGVARKPYSSKEDYIRELENRLSRTRQVMHGVFDKAKLDPKRILFPEGEAEKIVRAAKILAEEGICKPVLIGSREIIAELLADHEVPQGAIEVVDPASDGNSEAYAEVLTRMRWRHGVTLDNARKLMRDPVYFGNMMLHQGDADGLIAGLTMSYPETIRPALQIHKTREGIEKAAGLYLLLFEDRMLFIADTTVNQDPTAEELAEIAFNASQAAGHYFGSRAEGGHALLLELRLEHRCPLEQGPRGRRHRRAAMARPHYRGRDAGRYGRRTLHRPRGLSPCRGSRATPTSWSAPTSSQPTSPTSCCGGWARSKPSGRSSPASTRRSTFSSAASTSTTSSTWPLSA